jgi:hypothetical protein
VVKQETGFQITIQRKKYKGGKHEKGKETEAQSDQGSEFCDVPGKK